MSHFQVMVVGNDPEAQLAPFHEFECTGHDDQYVQDVDVTAEAIEEYGKSKSSAVRMRDGTIVSLFVGGDYRPEFVRPATDDEVAAIKSGRLFERSRVGFNYYSKDNGVYMVVALPAGAEEAQVETKTIEDFATWASGYYGLRIAASPEGVNKLGDHKYGHVLVFDGGVRVIDRTNPNKKWDWYVLGGRWSESLLLKPGHISDGRHRVDSCLKGEIDVEGMRSDAAREAGDGWDAVHAVLAPHLPIRTWRSILEEIAGSAPEKDPKNVDHARDVFNSQPGVKAFRASQHWAMHLDDVLVTRDEYVESFRSNALTPFAIVIDGQWYERGEMGWWGVVRDEKDRVEWSTKVAELLSGVSDDTLISMYDCHI